MLGEMLEWGGAPTHGLRISCARAGAGRRGLFSVRVGAVVLPKGAGGAKVAFLVKK